VNTHIPFVSSVAGALLAAAIPAQGGLQTIKLDFPSTQVGSYSLPGDALKSDLANAMWGFPTDRSPCQIENGTKVDCAWPVSTIIGDIDNDGQLDALLVMEQRLLLAVGFQRDASGTPIDTYMIWAWWDPTTEVFKHGWSLDTACIGDFDGDGLNEVAALVGPDNSGTHTCDLGGPQGSYRVAILGQSTSTDPNFGGLPRPSLLADWKINTAIGGWTCSLLHGTNGKNANLRVVHMSNNPAPDDPAAPRELLFTDQGPKRAVLLRFDGTSLSNTASFTQNGVIGTHIKRVADLDGDGYDEVIGNGVLDLIGNSEWNPGSLPFFNSCSNQYNHIDSIQPWDHDGDGDLELACVHDCYDFVLEGADSGGMAVPVWSPAENTLAPAFHGQSVCIGEFVAGADIFGWNAREALITPKGLPGLNSTSGGAGWSYIYNGNSWEMAFCHPPTGVGGPRDFDARNIDWDGDRTTDEIFARYANSYEVWRVTANPSYSGPTNQDPTPPSFPTASEVSSGAKTWPSYPYQFELVDSFAGNVDGGVGSAIAVDLFGDYREEIVNAGRNGIQIAFNTDTNPTPIAHPSPWTDADYRSRQQGVQTDTVNYQQLGTLQGIEVFPAVAAVDTNGQLAYQAFAIYSNGARVNVTADATFTAGPHGTFQGFRFIGGSHGICAVQAEVHGVKSDNAAVCRVTDDTSPMIVYAGYGDTYLLDNTPGDLTIEVGVADLDGDVAQLGLSYSGTALPYVFRDDGQAGDRVANDGIWTAFQANSTFPTADIQYLEVTALDANTQSSNTWPYLTLGTGGGTPVAGVPYVPWASELTVPPGHAPVYLTATGVAPGSLPETGGSATLFARALPGAAPDLVSVWINGELAPIYMNDLGMGDDQIEGDGLWTGTGQWSLDPVVNGRFVIEFVAGRLATDTASDAYPRLRSHQ